MILKTYAFKEQFPIHYIKLQTYSSTPPINTYNFFEKKKKDQIIGIRIVSAYRKQETSRQDQE